MQRTRKTLFTLNQNSLGKRQSMDTSSLMLEQTIIIMHNDIEDNMLVINEKIG